MINGFFFRFLMITHSEGLSRLLSYLARFIFFLRFLLKKLMLKKETVEMTKEQALEVLRSTSPEPEAVIDYSMTPVSDQYDLSVIVPVYNHLNVLGRCIDSLVNQKTQYSYELILVDDGSTDGAETFIEQYAALPFVHVIHQENAGIAAARNTGIREAVGRYLMFADCDDYVHEDLIECLMARAEQEDVDIVMCAHAVEKVQDGKVYSRLENIEPIHNLMGYNSDTEILSHAGLPWGKVYKRELFECVRFFPGYWYEDTIIHSLIFTQCRKFVYVPEVQYEYQWHEGNFTHIQANGYQKKAVDRYWLLKAILKRYEELELPKDARFYTMLIKHVSAYYYPTVAGLPEEVIQAMFVMARELLLQYQPQEKVRLPYMLRQTGEAIKEDSIALWKLCSVNQ